MGAHAERTFRGEKEGHGTDARDDQDLEEAGSWTGMEEVAERPSEVAENWVNVFWFGLHSEVSAGIPVYASIELNGGSHLYREMYHHYKYVTLPQEAGYYGYVTLFLVKSLTMLSSSSRLRFRSVSSAPSPLSSFSSLSTATSSQVRGFQHRIAPSACAEYIST